MIRLRSSESDRVLRCNGSITLTRLVDARDGDEGQEGTWLHWRAHERLQKEFGAVGDIGIEPPRPKSAAFSEWIADFYVNAVKQLVPDDWSLESEVALEYVFPISPFVEGAFSVSGHPDDVGISPDGKQAIIPDLKTGYDPVDPADCNEQIFTYAVLLLEAYPDLEKITCYIIQPRNDEDEGFQRISEPMVLEGERLRNARAVWLGRMQAAIANRHEVDTGHKQCKWCPAAMQCPAQLQLREIMKVQLTPEMLAHVKAKPDDATLGDWVMASRALGRPMEDAEKMLKERIAEQGSVTAGDGTMITIKEEGGSYSFPDPVAFYRATREILTGDEEYAVTVKPSVTSTKDAIAKKLGIPKTSKKETSAQSVFDGALRPLCEQGVRRKLVFT